MYLGVRNLGALRAVGPAGRSWGSLVTVPEVGVSIWRNHELIGRWPSKMTGQTHSPDISVGISMECFDLRLWILQDMSHEVVDEVAGPTVSSKEHCPENVLGEFH